MGVAVLNTWYGYILRTKMIMVQKRPKYHPEVSKLLDIEMHTQLLSATRVFRPMIGLKKLTSKLQAIILKTEGGDRFFVAKFCIFGKLRLKFMCVYTVITCIFRILKCNNLG